MQEDPRLNRNKVQIPRLNIYEKNPVLSTTLHLEKLSLLNLIYVKSDHHLENQFDSGFNH
jgi:hypothetical protein